MLGPIFSASHSSKWVERRKVGIKSQVYIDTADYWVQKGVTAHGEVWETHFETESETVADALQGGGCASNDERRPVSSEAEATGSESHTRLTRQPMPAVQRATQLLSFRQSRSTLRLNQNMAPKIYPWISIWCVEDSATHMLSLITSTSAGSSLAFLSFFWDAAYCFFRYVRIAHSLLSALFSCKLVQASLNDRGLSALDMEAIRAL